MRLRSKIASSLLLVSMFFSLLPMSSIQVKAESSDIKSKIDFDAKYSFESVIVCLKEGKKDFSDKNRIKEKGYKIKQVLFDEGTKQIVLMDVPIKTKDGIVEAVNYLSEDSNVEVSEPDYCDIKLLNTYNKDSYYQETIDYLKNINVPRAWDITKGSSSVLVGVADTGFDRGRPDAEYLNPDITPSLYFNNKEIPFNSVDDDNNGYKDDAYGFDFSHPTPQPDGTYIYENGYDTSDDDALSGMFSDGIGHGTHVSGIIAAKGDNGLGVCGIAPNVKIIPLKFMGQSGVNDEARYSKVIAAFNYAKKMGVRIINCSWGMYTHSDAFEITISQCSNILFTVAAGNDSSSYLPYPAALNNLPNVISVGAVDKIDNLASFSNYGNVDIAAPGVDVFSTYAGMCIQKPELGGIYGIHSGTSMAAPFVAGTAALLLSKNINLTASELKTTILNNADVLPQLSGEINGCRRLNVGNAVLNCFPITQLQKRSAVLNKGQLYVKEGTNPSQLVLSGVNNFQIDGDKILVQKSDNNLYIQQGSLNNPWTQITTLGSTITQFQLEGSRIAVRKSDNFLWIKDNINDPSFQVISQICTTVKLDGLRVMMVGTNKNCYIKEGSNSVTTPWDNSIAANVMYVQLSGTILSYITYDSKLYIGSTLKVTNNVKSVDWFLSASNVRDAIIGQTMSCYRDVNNGLHVGNTWEVVFPYGIWLSPSNSNNVSSFKVDKQRIAYISTTTRNLYIIDGNAYEQPVSKGSSMTALDISNKMIVYTQNISSYNNSYYMADINSNPVFIEGSQSQSFTRIGATT